MIAKPIIRTVRVVSLAAMMVAGRQLHAQDLTTGLVNQWVGDDYPSGGSWIDRIKGVVATPDGTPAPIAVNGIFLSHKGVMRSGATTGNGGFLIPAANAPTGFTNYTVAIVFQATAAGPTSGSYFNDQLIFGYDIAGTGQADWGVSWGGDGSRAGEGVVGGIGRANGDSQVESSNTPLPLNTTHTAVFQINGGAKTETLYVDGSLTSQNAGLAILAPTNSNGSGAIPLLSTANTDVNNAFGGAIAEVRIYTNATVSGPALGTFLQNFYTKATAITLAVGAPVASAGNAVSVVVTVPAAVTQTSPFMVTLTSDNQTVTATTNAVVPTGMTNATIPLLISGAGVAHITASGPGVLTTAPVSISGLVAGAVVPLTWFKADAITGVTNNGAVSNWVDYTGNAHNATQTTASAEPTFVTNAMNKLPVVRFNAANNTDLAFNRTVQDDFTIICIFQSTQGLNSGTLYYQGAGLVNGEVGGVVNDFGTCLFANGSISAGTGSPDVAVNSAAGFNDGRPHIMTFSRSRTNGLVNLYVDGSFAGSVVGSTDSLTAPSVLVLGAQQTLIQYLSGDIAEVQVYNIALSGTNQQNAESPLFLKYNIPPPPPVGLNLQLVNGQIVLNFQSSGGAANYLIERATSPGGPFSIIATNASTNFTDTISPANIYYYAVAALGAAGTGSRSVAVGTDTLLGRHEPPGPSRRTTPIAISEIMWKPAPRTDGKNLEYIEIYNSNPWYQDISGYQLTCADVSYTFPPNTSIGSNSFIVIAAAPADVQSVYGITNVMGSYTGSLKKSETLELLDEQTNVLLTVPYTGIYPWPVATSGTGHSLTLSNPSYGESDPRAWDNSTFAGGSPGAADVYPANVFGNVVINELLPHSENPAVPQFIELYNHGNTSNDISGCVLTDNPATNKFVIPAGTVLPPGGFISFTSSQFQFTLNGAGETVYLLSADNTRILDAVQFGAQADGVSFGRWPDGANDFYAFTTNTPGTNNSTIAIGNIVINELMYDPISGNDDDQYIELYNQGTNAVNLAGWQLSSAVTFTFPSVTLAAGGYLVVARNVANLLAKYPNLTTANTVGNYSGKLSHSGELLVLSAPQTLFTNTTIMVAEDQVTYGTGGRWGQWAGGGGSSLELIDPHSNHRLAANWTDSDESQKSSWTTIQFTGVLDNGQNYGSSIANAQIGILDVGECLVDNVQVLDVNNINYVSNSTFETGTNGWSFQGSQVRSSLENSGYQSSHSLHVRASDRYYNGDDSCQAMLMANSLAAGQTATLSFMARWIHGWPEAILRLNGGWLEATGPLPVPGNMGTPGLPNTARVTNAGPAIYNVTHSPALPAVNQSAVVSVCAHDADGLQNLTLNYRIDPSTNYISVPLLDNGTGGDVVAGDGIFSATIPGQAANTLVAYYVTATDDLGAATRFPALLTDNTPTRECLILFGDGNPTSSFGVYHLWLTQANVNRWGALGNLSNEGIDATMVEANRIIYNAQAHFAGSPVHQDYDRPDGTLCSYKWIFQDDDKFLGETSFNKIHLPGNTDNDPTYQREQLANTFLRALHVPWLNRRDVVLYVNGNRRGPIMEDAQTPDSDYVKEYFPNDSNGFLYKIARWYEFAPSQSGFAQPDTLASEATILPYTTTGGAKKLARYRFTFENRRTPDTVNDYMNVFSLVDAASSHGQPNYVKSMEDLVNMENWMRVFAANHAAGNWDCFGSDSGQNLYPYTGTAGTKWTLLMYDFNIGLGIDGSYPPGQDLFVTLPQDTNIGGIYSEPTFLRMYWRALGELLTNGPLNLSLSVPLMNAKYAALTANGISVEDPNLNLIPFVTQAVPNVAAQVRAANATSFFVSGSVISNNVAVFTGQAPFNVDTVWINGAAYPIKWTTVTNWSVTVPLRNGANAFSFTGLDRNGLPIPGDTGNTTINYSGTNALPAGQIVINEIMYAAPVAGAGFVELYNNSTSASFDLSGWQIPGLAYTFPSGSLIAPTNFLVLAADKTTFAGVYGASIPVFDTFSGVLGTSGMLALNSSTNTTVAEVKYESQAPWPTNLSATDSSLQLIDPHQDNWRVGNWSWTSGRATPGAPNSVLASLAPFPSLYLNEVEPGNLTGITNSAGQHVPWLELYNPSTNAISLNGLYLADNYANLLQWAFPSNAVINAGEFKVIFADGELNLSASNELHISFILPATTGSLAFTRLASNGQQQVLDYIDYENIAANDSYGSSPDGQSFDRQVFFQVTPGAPNNGTSTPPPSFIEYLTPGSVYTQNFDALPNPGATSVNTTNPVTINGVTYSLANPYDFAFPANSSGGTGGLGITTMAGWYGTSGLLSRFGATDGDQTTGGQISFGLPNSGNRSLGLLDTSTTATTAFGVRFVNGTGATLNRISVQVTGAVWRQSDKSKTLQCYYFVDSTGTNSFPANATSFLPALNVVFPTVTADSGGAAVDGSTAANQTNLLISNQPITNWPTGAALWLVWQMTDPTGKAQGLAIDNFSFSAGVPAPVSLNIQASGTNLVLEFPTVPGQSYQLQYTDELSPPTWLPLGDSFSGNGSTASVTNNFSVSAQRYYRLVWGSN